MQTDLTEIKEFLKNKHICLLGNAKSILKAKKNIDKYDIICRMNRAVPKGKGDYIGSRTDVLFISTRFREEWDKQFNAKFIVWMTECQKLTTDWIKKKAIQNPLEDWRELQAKYSKGKLPSTGCIALYFLIKHIRFKKLTIYGFDFFETGTWYHNLRKLPWHDVVLEKKIILNMIKNIPNVEIIYE